MKKETKQYQIRRAQVLDVTTVGVYGWNMIEREERGYEVKWGTHGCEMSVQVGWTE